MGAGYPDAEVVDAGGSPELEEDMSLTVEDAVLEGELDNVEEPKPVLDDSGVEGVVDAENAEDTGVDVEVVSGGGPELPGGDVVDVDTLGMLLKLDCNKLVVDVVVVDGFKSAAGIALSSTTVHPGVVTPSNVTTRVDPETQKMACPPTNPSFLHCSAPVGSIKNWLNTRNALFAPGVSGDTANGCDVTSPEVETYPLPLMSCPDCVIE